MNKKLKRQSQFLASMAQDWKFPWGGNTTPNKEKVTWSSRDLTILLLEALFVGYMLNNLISTL